MRDKELEKKLARYYAQVPAPPEGLSAGRQRMLEEAAHLRNSLAPASLITERTRRPKMPLVYKFLTILVVALVGMGAAGGGVALASADSLPGETLYTVKLAVEDLRLWLASDPAAQAEQTLDYLAERGQEITELTEMGESIPDQAVQRMIRQMDQVMTRIALAPPDETMTLLAQFSERLRIQQQILEKVQAQGPDAGQPALHTALEATRRLNQQAVEAQQAPEKFRHEYQNRYDGSPGPHGNASVTPHATGEHHTSTPDGNCGSCTPEQNQYEYQYEGTPGPHGTAPVTPAGTRVHATVTPEPPGPGQNSEQDRPPQQPASSPKGDKGGNH